MFNSISSAEDPTTISGNDDHVTKFKPEAMDVTVPMNFSNLTVI
jgi:hypothetical protein